MTRQSRSRAGSQSHEAHAAAKQDVAFSLHNGYISQGGDLLWQTMTVEEAKRKAAKMPDCKGFSFNGVDTGAPLDIVFKDKWNVNAGEGWSSYRIEYGAQRIEVQRLTASVGGRGWRYHDRRTLQLSNGELYIFDKGSTSKVKLVVDIAKDVQECVAMPGSVISLTLRRWESNPEQANGTAELKPYVFEFPTARSAAAFYQEVHRALEQRRRD